MADEKLTQQAELTAPVLTDIIYGVDDPAGTPESVKIAFERALAMLAPAPGGRLTLTTAVPVTTSDVTAATTLYYTPHNNNLVRLFDGTSWKLYAFTERSISIPATTDTNYDVFLFDNAGTLTLELTAWTNDTTRATALVRQDGVFVKTGATTRLYLGTVRTTGVSGQCEDSASKRFCWNMYNRTARPMLVTDTTDTWTYNAASWRATNNNTANRVHLVVGVAEVLVVVMALGRANASSGVVGSVGVGIDTTAANSAQIMGENSVTTGSISAIQTAYYNGALAVGYHYLQWIEYARAGTVTFSGDSGNVTTQSGLMASIPG